MSEIEAGERIETVRRKDHLTAGCIPDHDLRTWEVDAGA